MSEPKCSTNAADCKQKIREEIIRFSLPLFRLGN